MARNPDLVLLLRQERDQLELKLAAIRELLAHYEGQSVATSELFPSSQATPPKPCPSAHDDVLDAAAKIFKRRTEIPLPAPFI